MSVNIIKSICLNKIPYVFDTQLFCIFMFSKPTSYVLLLLLVVRRAIFIKMLG